MEGICELEEIDGEEWVIFLEYRFNNVLSPEIIEFLSEYQKVKFGTDFNQPVTYQTDSSPKWKISYSTTKLFNSSYIWP